MSQIKVETSAGVEGILIDMVHDDNNLPQPIIQTLENSRTLEYEHPSRHRY